MSYNESSLSELGFMADVTGAELFMGVVKTLVAAHAIISPFFPGMWPRDYGKTALSKG